MSGKENTERQITLNNLIHYAVSLGATDARIIPARSICVENRFADLCSPSTCTSYGQSMSCPPHVSGPSGFRKLLAQFEHALVFKIDVPNESLFFPTRQDVFRRLHEIASSLQRQASLLGFFNAKGFAGGSCKEAFCASEADCLVVAQGGPCRHPHKARPSMSGFGVDVAKLMAAAGFEMVHASAKTPETDGAEMVPVVGVVLIG